jgi:hypothetical protein
VTVTGHKSFDATQERLRETEVTDIMI